MSNLYQNEIVWVKSCQRTGIVQVIQPPETETAIVSIGGADLFILLSDIAKENPWKIGNKVQLKSDLQVKEGFRKGSIVEIYGERGTCLVRHESGYQLEWSFKSLSKISLGEECPSCHQILEWQDAFYEDTLVCGC